MKSRFLSKLILFAFITISSSQTQAFRIPPISKKATVASFVLVVGVMVSLYQAYEPPKSNKKEEDLRGVCANLLKLMTREQEEPK
jgi:hypothetical protein